ncbi:VCBS repeat-containing protein [Sorangium sp. So ce448]|uniref:FG-GAP repeat domain-containing protein n=1 Tax=Sorangium sp. So ce448 TaxID=3133314 RepID=UPI003F644AA8
MKWNAFVMAGLLSLSLPSVSPAAEECGSIFFAPGTSELDVPVVTRKVRFADMDGNGADDWILIETHQFTLDLRNRDGTQLASSTYPDAGGGDVFLHQVEVADVTGDGQLDFIVKDDQGVSVVQQTSGNLTPLGTIHGTPSTRDHLPLLLAAGHFLSRSQADIVVETAAGELRLFHASDGAFRAVQTLSDVAVLEKSFVHGAAMPTGDVDGDGLQDLLYPSVGGLANAQRTASGSFQPNHRLAMDESYELGAFGDFDGNGLQDVAVVARRPRPSGYDELLLQTWLQAPAGTFRSKTRTSRSMCT